MIKLNHIQSLRGIAALLVCCFHLRERINFPELPLGNMLFLNGGIGVPIFFIISGFIMVYTTKKYGENPKIEIKDFLKKRIIRVVPLYYFLTFAWMVIGGTFLIYFTPDVFPRFYYSLLFLPNNNFPPVLFLGWSLNYEMFFYFVFALTILFRKYRYVVFIGVFSILLLLGLLFSWQNAYLKMATSFTNAFFLIGVIFGLIFNKLNLTKKQSIVFSVFGILTFVLFYLNFPKNENIIIVSIFFLSFLILDKANVPAKSFMVFLGDLSYSIYLTHPFVELFFRRFKTTGVISSIFIFVIEIIVVIIVSKICYELIEKRFTQYLKLKL